MFPFWKNVDYYAKKEFVDYKINLEENHHLPFEDNTVNLIYSSHFLEHISKKSQEKLLTDCYRVLKHGGFIRLNLPTVNGYGDHGLTVQPDRIYGLLEKIGFQQIRFMGYHRSRVMWWMFPYFDNHPKKSYRLEATKL